MKDLHTYGTVVRARGGSPSTTRPPTARAPFDANAAAKAAGARRSSVPRTASFRPGAGFREFFFDRDGRHRQLDTRGGAAFGGFGGVFRLDQHDPSADTGTLRLFSAATRTTPASTTSPFLTQNAVAVVEDPGDTLHTQRERARLRLAVRRRADYSAAPRRCASSPRAATRRRRSTRAALAARRASRTTATTRSPASTSPTATRRSAACSARKRPHLFQTTAGASFWTQQHGDNMTFEIRSDRHDRTG